MSSSGPIRLHPGAAASWLALVARLALASYGENKDGVCACHEAIKRDISVRSPADDELALAPLNGSANKGAVSQHLDRLNDFLNARVRVIKLVSGQVAKKTVEITKDPRR